MSNISQLKIIFLFPGQGHQYSNMTKDLYKANSTFNYHMNQCFQILKNQHQIDLAPILYPIKQEDNTIHQIIFSTISIFCVEFSLAQVLISRNINPSIMLGNSLGEYTAACISGVLTLADAIHMAVIRSSLMAKLPPGKMVGASLSADEVKHLLPANISIAADLGDSCILSGPDAAISELQKTLTQQKVFTHPLNIDCPGHSTTINQFLPEFVDNCREIHLQPPTIPFFSNITGDYISSQQAQDIYYWASQMQQTVQLAKSCRQLLSISNAIFLEIGPGNSLCLLLSQLAPQNNKITLLNLIQNSKRQHNDVEYFDRKLKQLTTQSESRIEG